MSKRNGLSDTQKINLPDEARTPRPPRQRLEPQQRSLNPSQRRQSSAQEGQGKRNVPPANDPFEQEHYERELAQRNANIRRPSWQGRETYDTEPAPYSYQQPEYAEEFAEEEEPDAPKRRKKHRRRRHSCLRRIFTSLLLTTIILFGIYSAISLLAIRKLKYVPDTERAVTENMAEPDKNVRNLLIIGSDSRGEERGRADSVILMSFSKHNKTVTLTSLLRDSYVSIPGYGTAKLNAAYSYGGPTLLMDTIIANYGIPVDDYICINFKAFVNLTDALKGIEVTVSDEEAQEINNILQTELNELFGDEPTADFLPSGGTFVLNGKQALAYSRIRYVGNADFERSDRQRDVLSLLLERMKTMPSAVPELITVAAPELTTNMTKKHMYLLSLLLPQEMIRYDMQTLRLPADGTFSLQTAPDGQLVLAVDFDANREIYVKTVTQKQEAAQ